MYKGIHWKVRMWCRKNVLENGYRYWDWLPPKIQKYILQFAIFQHAIDIQRKEQLKKLCQDFKQYFKLKDVWEHGFLKLEKNGRIQGHYVDIEKRKQEVFLGNKYTQANCRLNHVKSKLNSNQAFKMDDSFTVETAFICTPGRGRRHGKLYKPSVQWHKDSPNDRASPSKTRTTTVVPEPSSP